MKEALRCAADWPSAAQLGWAPHPPGTAGIAKVARRPGLPGEYQRAQQLIDPMPWTPSTTAEQHRLEKMAADVHLIQGRPQPLIDYAAARAADLPLPGEERFRELVAGKRVAVVGPADTGDRLGN